MREEDAEAQRIKVMEREAEAEEEERRAAQQAPVQPPADDVAVVWETTFPLAGLTSTLVNLTGPDDDEEEDV